MFYRLSPSYVLRGWDKMAWTLVKRPENQVKSLSADIFQVLLLCDGQTKIEEYLPDEALEKALRQCEKEGWIEACESPCPLETDQYYKYYHNRHVHMVFWSVTGRCNFRCRHCFMDAPEGMLGELSTEEALDFIDQMADCGVLRVDLTGGEPFVRKDFWLLVDHILSYKITIGKVYTNGWLLNEQILDEFERRGLKPDISISFDGIGWHDWMRGVEGAEEAALRALRLCAERGFKTDVEMCIHRGNQDLLEETVQVLSGAGVTDLKTSNVALTELWNCHSEGNALDWHEYVEAMIRYIPQYFKAGRPMNLILANVIILNKDAPYRIVPEAYNGTEKCLECYMCGNTRWSCYITPDGRLLPCMPMTASQAQLKFPKVQDIGLKQGLSDSFYMQFVNGRIKDLFAVNGECATCSYRLKCGGGCRASALLEGNRNLMGCDRTMCMLWKEGYVDRIRKVTEEAILKYEKNKKSACHK
ncbi:MAG TPA: radical SAM protein [Candidatus Blautia gallistercoris]|uniref:Radical SAM protein n=1 Tax=Candidatus Blautia gallistercoris TaxID=2838490 RepID=A0A9D2B232_9FIRM|nr:radical SAM protein [Candidatus Blautia gallistercoris]